MSWSRAVKGGAWVLGAFILAVAGFMTLRALGDGPAASLLAEPGHDRAKAIDAYQRQVEMGDFSNADSLSELLWTRRDFARAESLAHLRIRAQPEHGLTYSNLAVYHLTQRELREADSVLTVAAAHAAVTPRQNMTRAAIAIMRDSVARGVALLDAARRTSDDVDRALALRMLAELRFAQGQIAASRQLIAEVQRLDASRGAPSSALVDAAADVQRDAWLFGPNAEHVPLLNAAVAAATPAEQAAGRLQIAGAYADAGAAGLARELVAQWNAETRDTVARRVSRPALDAAQARIALAERLYPDALAAFHKADSASDGPVDACVSCLPLHLAHTFALLGRADSAVYYFERFLSTATIGPYERLPVTWSYVPVVERRLGEFYERRGDAVKAYHHYERFVRHWQNADSQLRPRVDEARQRMARLRNIERR